MFLKNVFMQFLIAFFEDDARNKKQKPKYFFLGGGGGSGDMGSSADTISVQAAIPFMYLANQVKINAFVAL